MWRLRCIATWRLYNVAPAVVLALTTTRVMCKPTNSTFMQPSLDPATPISSVLSGTDILATGGHLSIFGHILTAHALKLLFSSFWLKILTSPSDFSDRDFMKDSHNSAIRRSALNHSRLCICHVSDFGLFELITLNICHTLRNFCAPQWDNFNQV